MIPPPPESFASADFICIRQEDSQFVTTNNKARAPLNTAMSWREEDRYNNYYADIMEPVVYGSVVLKPVVIEPVPMDIDNDVRALLAYGERHQQFDQAVHGRRRQFAGMTWSYDNRLVRQTLRVEKGKDRNQNQAASVWAAWLRSS